MTFDARWADAISSIESGGNYGILGPVTRNGDRAYGRYQVMGANIGPWTKEVLGKSLTPQEFVNSPQAQDAVYQAKFGQLAQKYGPVGAAKAWFAGERGMNNPNAKDALGTTVQGYADKFAAALGKSQPAAPQVQATAQPQQAAAPQVTPSQPLPYAGSSSSQLPQQIGGLDQLMSQPPAMPQQAMHPRVNVTGLLQILQSPQLRGLLQG